MNPKSKYDKQDSYKNLVLIKLLRLFLMLFMMAIAITLVTYIISVRILGKYMYLTTFVNIVTIEGLILTFIGVFFALTWPGTPSTQPSPDRISDGQKQRDAILLGLLTSRFRASMKLIEGETPMPQVKGGWVAWLERKTSIQQIRYAILISLLGMILIGISIIIRIRFPSPY